LPKTTYDISDIEFQLPYLFL